MLRFWKVLSEFTQETILFVGSWNFRSLGCSHAASLASKPIRCYTIICIYHIIPYI